MNPSEVAEDAAPATVLVADDERTVRSILARVLELQGYRVIAAQGGAEALALANQHECDAFLVDLYMPEIDGLAVCRELRDSARYRQTPILCMTAAEESRHVNAAFAAGADDFIVKPVNPTVLQARLRGQLERHASLREMNRLRANLNRYVSRRTQHMVQEYTRTGVLPPPEEAAVCVLFSDVRGFTRLSQEIDPQTLFRELSANLGMQVDCVYAHHGDVDKFAGDGIMAVFDEPDAALNACRCALDILTRTQSEETQLNKALLRLGIGIHCGPALIGNVGSVRHLDYSVIGETVNLAARLCGAAAPISAIVSSDVVGACRGAPEIRFGAAEQIPVRGMRNAVTVHALTPGAAGSC